MTNREKDKEIESDSVNERALESDCLHGKLRVVVAGNQEGPG